MQAAAAKEKQDAKAMYSILDNIKTVRFPVNANNKQVDQVKSEREKILSRAYLANTIPTAKTLPTSTSSTTITVPSPTTTKTTTAAHNLLSSIVIINNYSDINNNDRVTFIIASD